MIIVLFIHELRAMFIFNLFIKLLIDLFIHLSIWF